MEDEIKVDNVTLLSHEYVLPSCLHLPHTWLQKIHAFQFGRPRQCQASAVVIIGPPNGPVLFCTLSSVGVVCHHL